MTQPYPKPDKVSRPNTDRTPAWMRKIGLRPGQWQTLPKDQLRAIRNSPEAPPHIRVWACGMLHSYAYRADVAVVTTRNSRRPMTRADIASETGIAPANVHRALQRLELSGMAQRLTTTGVRLDDITPEMRAQLGPGGVQIRFFSHPQPLKKRATKAKETRSRIDPVFRRAENILKRFSAMTELHDIEQAGEIIRIEQAYRTAVSRLRQKYVLKMQMSQKGVCTDSIRESVQTPEHGPTAMKTKVVARHEKKVKEIVTSKRPQGPPARRNFLPPGERACERADPREVSPPARRLSENDHGRIREIKTLCNRILARRIGSVLTLKRDSELLAKISAALGEASTDQLAARLRARAHAVRSYAIVPRLAADCREAVKDWTDGEKTTNSPLDDWVRRKKAQ